MIYKKYIKRFFDIVLALFGLPFLLAITVIISPLIYFEDRGSIFYNASRLGQNGKTFKMYKFRSMKVNSPDIRNTDGTTYNALNDPRILRIGRFIRATSIDELPQLLNVLKGEMSLIGPRPDLPDAIENLYKSDYMIRLQAKPGITGYSQAYFRNTANLEQRFVQDIFYVEHISFMFDLKIFFKTIATVLRREGIYRNPSKEKEDGEITYV